MRWRRLYIYFMFSFIKIVTFGVLQLLASKQLFKTLQVLNICAIIKSKNQIAAEHRLRTFEKLNVWMYLGKYLECTWWNPVWDMLWCSWKGTSENHDGYIISNVICLNQIAIHCDSSRFTWGETLWEISQSIFLNLNFPLFVDRTSGDSLSSIPCPVVCIVGLVYK